jgi:hypothetical protein
MNPRRDEWTEDPALATATELARRSAPPATAALLDRGWSAVTGRLTARAARRRVLRRMATVGALAGAVVFAVVGMVSVSRTRLGPTVPAALAYRVEGGSVIEGGYLREAGGGGVKLSFAEGTEFILTSGSRGRLRSVNSVGARIAIEQGTASFQVTPRNNARWLVDVGPFLITVKGTVFAVAWDPSSERFDLSLQHGQVSVTGPVTQGEITLRAGQRLAINLPGKEILITEQKPEEAWLRLPAAAAVPSPAEAPAVERHAAVAPVPPPAAGPTQPVGPRGSGRRGWAEVLAAGDWDQILDDVNRAGVKRTLAEASSEDLFVLADAARYRRRMGLARAALLAERRRFPASTRALDALFMLGRLEEAKERGTSKALGWYEEYLTQAPTGTYASEALGRKMMATRALAGVARARPIAEEYLDRFPLGTYAGAARALLRAP